jgi:hypothetical protein
MVIILIDLLISVISRNKQELAELLEEDSKADKLRSLPLYSCRITGLEICMFQML